MTEETELLNTSHHSKNAIGKTIREIHEHGWRVEIIFTDDTKLQIEPGGIDEEDGENQPELIFQERLDAD